ncbi:alkaline phosphatase family protein [Candidatus Pacearchaeota archaeon]|nr:alkaline phosphatase family protein [Candidatus Pacearchaeota archaeon]
MAKKLIICIDGLGKDMLKEENMPFLCRFGKENYISELGTFFASAGIEQAFFSGKTPRESKIWLEFVRDENSIFNNFFLKFLSFSKKLRNYYAVFLERIHKRSWLSSLHNIPVSLIGKFDTSLKEGVWVLPFFQDKSFAVYKWPFFVEKDREERGRMILSYESDEERLERLVKSKDKEGYYTQLMSIDKAVHKYGKKSEEVKEKLKEMDKLIERYVKRFLEENKDAEIIIWSDHGFADINNYIDLWKALPKRKDYIFFIAGTTASFWFESKETEAEVRKILSEIKGIKILDEKSAKKYNIPLLREYGELIAYVEKGSYFFPNFYQKNEKEKFKAMHIYPDDKELNGIIVMNKKIKKNNLKINEVLEIIK